MGKNNSEALGKTTHNGPHRRFFFFVRLDADDSVCTSQRRMILGSSLSVLDTPFLIFQESRFKGQGGRLP